MAPKHKRIYQFNFTSFGSRRGRTSAQMGCLAITPSLMRYLRCRRSTADSFNANEPQSTLLLYSMFCATFLDSVDTAPVTGAGFYLT